MARVVWTLETGCETFIPQTVQPPKSDSTITCILWRNFNLTSPISVHIGNALKRRTD